MGSFVGHIDEALFFVILSFWWMFNMFTHYIQCLHGQKEFRSKLSYALPGKRKIPLEAILKTLFPIGGLIGEIFSEGIRLTDDEGNFVKLAQMQHMSIYTIFITHGIIDILMSYRLPLFKDADYISASLAFFWFGYSFSFHAHMHDKAMLETTIHVLPIPIMYIISVLSLAEMLFPCFIQISVLRCIAVMLLGTWLIQASFVMYIPFPLPGSSMNPRWNQLDDRNVHAIVASFGFHIILSIVITVLVYTAVHFYLKVKNKLHYAFQPIRYVEDNDVTVNSVVASQSKGLLDDDDVI